MKYNYPDSGVRTGVFSVSRICYDNIIWRWRLSETDFHVGLSDGLCV